MPPENLLAKWDLTSLRLKPCFSRWTGSLRKAVWELYVELMTFVATQHLAPEDGDESTALKSICELFGLTRAIAKSNGRDCINSARIAVVMLNQRVRPFTAK